MNFQTKLYHACKRKGVADKTAKKFVKITKRYYECLYGEYWCEMQKELRGDFYRILAQRAKEYAEGSASLEKTNA